MTPRRKRARKYIGLREQLAAALSMLLPPEQNKALREARVPAKTVIALFSPDHGHLHALGGSDKWFNLYPMLRAPHKEKSRKDTSIVAKVDRLAPAHEEFRRRILAKRPGQKPKKTGSIPSRPFPVKQRVKHEPR